MRWRSRILQSSGSLGQELHGSRTSMNKWLKEQGQRPASREREEQAELRGLSPSQTLKGGNQSHPGSWDINQGTREAASDGENRVKIWRVYGSSTSRICSSSNHMKITEVKLIPESTGCGLCICSYTWNASRLTLAGSRGNKSARPQWLLDFWKREVAIKVLEILISIFLSIHCQ